MDWAVVDGRPRLSVIPATSPSFPRKRESTPGHRDTPKATGVLDSGLRRNDGGAVASIRHSRPLSVIPAKAGIHSLPYWCAGDGRVGGWGRISLTQPSPAGRGRAWRPYEVGWFIQRWRTNSVGAHGRAPLPRIAKPTYHHETPPTSYLQPIPHPHAIIPALHRHSRESGNPRPTLSIRPGWPGFWIPAYAGMTVRGRAGWRWVEAVGGCGVRGESPQPPFCERGGFLGGFAVHS